MIILHSHLSPGQGVGCSNKVHYEVLACHCSAALQMFQGISHDYKERDVAVVIRCIFLLCSYTFVRAVICMYQLKWNEISPGPSHHSMRGP